MSTRGLLVLNLGSATLKAALFDLDFAAGRRDTMRDRDPALPLPFAQQRGGPGRGPNAATKSVSSDVADEQSPDTPPAASPHAIRRLTSSLHPSDSNDAEAMLERIASELGLHAPPAAVGHRIVHGGDATGSRRLDDAELDRLSRLSPLAPLHQPPVLALVHAARKRWPEAAQFGAFDTAFHAHLPPVSRRLPVPIEWDALGVRRYGFHGLAFASALRHLQARDPAAAVGRIVFAHLGGGSSLCAVRDGRSIDTTMSVTPLDGLPMARRSGALDPGAVLFLLRRHGMTAEALEHALYHDSGLHGIAGRHDMRELLASDASSAQLALDVFAQRSAQGIAAMATSLGGLDALVFSGGIGANAPAMRAAVVERLAWMGVRLDNAANNASAERIGAAESRASIWRVEVDEAFEIASAWRPERAASDRCHG